MSGKCPLPNAFCDCIECHIRENASWRVATVTTNPAWPKPMHSHARMPPEPKRCDCDRYHYCIVCRSFLVTVPNRLKGAEINHEGDVV